LNERAPKSIEAEELEGSWGKNKRLEDVEMQFS
jgi:hypothetical protein